MRPCPLVALLGILTPISAQAASISTAGYTAGPDSGAATPNPAAAIFNPAALAATTGVQVMADAQLNFIRIDATTTRNEGLDPNTGEAYNVAQARVMVPNFLVGVTWKAIPDRLAIGFAASDSFAGGGDYTAGEPGTTPPYTSWQRYAGVMSKIVTIHLVPAVGVTIVDGVHVGGGFKYILDSVDAIQASDPLGGEGMGADGPYTADSVLEIHGKGSHMGWNAGLFFDKFPKAQIGASYSVNGAFHAEGDGSVTAPAMISTIGGGVGASPEAKVTFDCALPPVLYTWFNSQITPTLMVGAGVEYQMWGQVAADHEGDIFIGVTSTDGDALGVDPEDGLVLQVGTDNWSPRRLRNAANIAANAGWQANKALWLGGRVGYQMSSVPDYAVSATNIDFNSVGAMVAGRYTLGKVEVGLAYTKFFLMDRVITNSAWDVRDTEDPNYVDEYFSPKNPYKAGANGTYGGLVDTVGIRLGMKL